MVTRIIPEYWEANDTNAQFITPQINDFLVLEEDGVKKVSGDKIILPFIELSSDNNYLEVACEFYDKVILLIRSAQNHFPNDDFSLKIVVRTELLFNNNYYCVNFAMGITPTILQESSVELLDEIATSKSMLLKSIPKLITENDIENFEKNKIISTVLLT